MDWTANELREMDRRMKTLLTITGTFHSRSQTGFISHVQKEAGFNLDRDLHETGRIRLSDYFAIESPRMSHRVSPTPDNRTNSIPGTNLTEKGERRKVEENKHYIDKL